MKYALSRTIPYRKALAEHNKRWSEQQVDAKTASGDKSPHEKLLIYKDNAFLCPCTEFKHWNSSIISNHIDNHEEFKFFKEALWKAGSRYDYLTERSKDAKMIITAYEKRGDTTSREYIRAREELERHQRDLLVEFDRDTLAILRQYRG